VPLEAPLPRAAERADALNARYRHHSATAVVKHALRDPEVGRVALVSSFGAESVALLHMVSVVDPSTPVLFLNTGKHFPETLAYQEQLTERLGLTDLRVVEPDLKALFARDPDGVLHIMDPDACCRLRKVEPLERGLAEFDAWITGRKRYQGGMRTELQHFEVDGGRIKVNPLAHWAPDDIQEYITNNRLPRHPLAEAAMPSIGCAPCTSAIQPGEDPRAGRWRNSEKVECGIHLENGRMVRG
jgi:phosphoadenosine phosphosulfate reductase